jgi:phenylpropionate dioxygenase-like ring-hydroxylating dioxygenase large terminal subunit
MTVPVRSVPGTADAAIAELVACQPAGHSLSQSFYVSEVAFQVDIDRVFMRHRLLVGHASSAPKPGDYFLCEIAEESVIIARGKDDLLRAFLNICRHRGSRICTKSEGHAEAFVCPYHAWAYNVDGTLRGARYMPADFDKSLHGLNAIHIEVIEGLVFISFADKPLGLETVRSAVRSAHGPMAGQQRESLIARPTPSSRTGNWPSRTILNAITARRLIRNIRISMHSSSPSTGSRL